MADAAKTETARYDICLYFFVRACMYDGINFRGAAENRERRDLRVGYPHVGRWKEWEDSNCGAACDR